MTARYFPLRLGALSTIVLLAACGGGGGGGGGTMLPPTTQPASAGAPTPQAVAFSIAIPSATTSSALRRPRYVSAGTKSAAITAAGTTTVVNCGQTCAATLSLVPGQVSIAVALYDAANGSGNVLSRAATTATIVAGQNNAISVEFDGVPASVAVTLGSSSVTSGSTATIPVSVAAKDAAGYTIIGSQPYASPIALSDDDATGATSLSTATLTSPGVTATLSYNGNAAFSGAHIGASIAGTTAQGSAALGITRPTAAPAPGPGAPSHVQTWYYYGLTDANMSVPVSYMVSHADFVEDDGFTAQHAEAFKDAGGRYAVSYTDPAYTPACVAPFSAPAGACSGPIGNLVNADESAWFHSANGSRVNRYDSYNGKYQEALNPASAAARNAYASATAAIVAAAPKLDFFFADDSGGTWTGPDGTTMSGWFYGFNAPAVEIASDAAFVPAEESMLAAAARPVIINGSDPGTLLPSYNGAFLGAQNVSGDNWEGCLSDGSGVAGTRNGRWVEQSNGLLMTTAHKSLALCMMYAAATPANRIYELASWWMTYDPTYSVASPQTPAADGTTIFPEYDLVPRQPLATATAAVGELSPAANVYVREFGACYQAGTAIGPCAAIVNIGSSSVAVPALRGHYSAALSVDAASAYAGGKATWTGPVPTQLAALSAVVLR